MAAQGKHTKRLAKAERALASLPAQRLLPDSMKAIDQLDPSLSSMNDRELSRWLKAIHGSETPVVVVFQAYLCKIGVLHDPDKQLVAIDPRKEAATAFKSLASEGLLLIAEDCANSLSETNSFGDLSVARSSWERLKELMEERERSLDHANTRGRRLSQAGILTVWCESGGRCMFEGCGGDLSQVALHTKPAQAAYLAHIIAAHPKGPRGDDELSHQLADCPSNIMLMCDSHHRLIDRISPDTFTVSKLTEMRKSHEEKVRSLLDSLSYKPSVGVSIFSDLAGVASAYSPSDLLAAAIQEKLNLTPTIHSFLNRKSRDKREREGFWSNYLHDMEPQIRELTSSLRDGNRLSSRATLAVYPLHHVPMLVLSGRILGEARPIEVFQYHRDLGTWCWQPYDEHTASSFFHNLGEKKTKAKEALVSIELTANLDCEALPQPLKRRLDSGEIQQIRVGAKHPSFASIRTKSDLDAFAQVARRVINVVHDELCADKVHLIGIAPASALFKVGQMLQPGHHPEYWVYDRSAHETQFQPAIKICGNYVSEINRNPEIHIELR